MLKLREFGQLVVLEYIKSLVSVQHRVSMGVISILHPT